MIMAVMMMMAHRRRSAFAQRAKLAGEFGAGHCAESLVEKRSWSASSELARSYAARPVE
jgi:hypothetical protein